LQKYKILEFYPVTIHSIVVLFYFLIPHIMWSSSDAVIFAKPPGLFQNRFYLSNLSHKPFLKQQPANVQVCNINHLYDDRLLHTPLLGFAKQIKGLCFYKLTIWDLRIYSFCVLLSFVACLPSGDLFVVEKTSDLRLSISKNANE